MGLKLGLKSSKSESENSWIKSNINPYSQQVLGNIGTYLDSSKRVTSIPSPYARMHLFDIAFRECTNSDPKSKSEYNKCVSHCLDLFELFFYFDNEKMLENGLSVERIKLERNTDNRAVEKTDTEKAHRIFYNSLSVFRENYKKAGKLLDAIYILKKGSKIIAGTSPFTGFFTAPDYSSEKDPIWYNGKLLLSDSDELKINNKEYKNQWKGYKDRGEEFKKFLYMLFYHTDLKNMFHNFFKYVESFLDNDKKTKWEVPGSFMIEFPQFNYNPALDIEEEIGFPLRSDNVKLDFIPNVIPDKYDSLFLKFLLFPTVQINFELKENQYTSSVKKRKLLNKDYPWVSVCDFLSDSLLVLFEEINIERFHTIPVVTDEGGKKIKYNVLPPLKKRYLEYFKITSIENNLFITKLGEGDYDVTLEVPVGAMGQKLRLKKRYKKDGEYPYGNVISKELKLRFGIYPFIKTPDNIINFYKILNYYPDNYSVGLDFFRYENGYLNENHNENKLTEPAHGRRHIRKITSYGNLKENLKYINEYYSLEGRYFVEGDDKPCEHDVSFDLISMDIQEILEPGDKNNGRIAFKGEVLIVPKFAEILILENANSGIVAIDLGSTNTYLAYKEDTAGTNPNIIEYKSTSEKLGDCEFVVLSKPEGDKKKLKFDIQGESTIHQLCEFMPSYFGEEGYHFPIPTALNIRGLAEQQIIDHPKNPLSILADANIPFAYYERGIRKLGRTTILDRIQEDFKWIDATELGSQEIQVLKLFMDQLILMVRNNFILRGFNLDGSTLIWSYPLSFDPPKIKEYSKMWEQVYKKYFGDKVHNILSASESRTPVFLVNAAARGSIVSVDIGGGSTDVIMYRNGEVSLATSFHFAGNCLFGDNGDRIDRVLNKENVFFKHIKEYLSDIDKNKGNTFSSETMVADPEDSNISTLMNYCFTTGCKVASKFLKKEISTLNMIHNCAIIYQIAQICKMQKGNIQIEDKIPKTIYFSGNGSNLLMLAKDSDSVANRTTELLKISKKIFMHVFTNHLGNSKDHIKEKDACELLIEGSDNQGGINIIIDENPKAATAKGALKGVVALRGRVTAKDDINNYWVPIGDCDTIHKVDPDNGSGLISRKELLGNERKLNDIKKNVHDFLSMYFEIVHYTHAGKDIKKEFIMNVLNANISIKDAINYELKREDRGDNLNDSLFLVAVAQILKDLVKAFNNLK